MAATQPWSGHKSEVGCGPASAEWGSSPLGGWVDYRCTYNVLHPLPFSWWDTSFPEMSLVGSYENPSTSHTHYLAGSETGLT